MVFLPAGWMMCEKSLSTTLLYGCRKSYVLDHPSSMASFQGCIEVLKSSGRDPSKMEDIVTLYNKRVKLREKAASLHEKKISENANDKDDGNKDGAASAGIKDASNGERKE